MSDRDGWTLRVELNRVITFVFSVLLFSIANAAVAASSHHPEDGVDELSHRLMIATGTDEMADRFGRSTSKAIVEAISANAVDSTIDEGQRRRIVEAAETSFAPLSMTWIVERNLRAALSDADMDELLEHHESAFGRQLRAAERARDASSDAAAFQNFLSHFGAEDGDAERYALLRRLVTETAMHEKTAALLIDIQVVRLHSTFGLLDKSSPDELAAAVAAIEASRKSVTRSLLDSLPLMFAFTYDGFDTDEHRRLLEFNLSAVARRATDGVFDGIREAYVAGTFDFQRRVRPAIALADATDGI